MATLVPQEDPSIITVTKHLILDTPRGPVPAFNDARNETLGAIPHFFSAIYSLKPDKWTDWRTCWELFHDMNLVPDERKFSIYTGKKYSVSVNSLIDRVGTNIELAPVEARTWHAGRSIMNGREKCNNFTIGYELIAAPFMAMERNGKYNQELLLIYGYTDEQYLTLSLLVYQAMRRYGFGMNWIQGHDTVRAAWNAVAPPSKRATKKRDPGPTFDWDKLRLLIQSHFERDGIANEFDLDGG